MLIERVVLEKRKGLLGTEEQLILAQAEVLGIPTVYACEKNMSRGFVRLSKTDLVVGGLSFMRHAGRVYGRTVEDHSCYPQSLQPFLNRKVERVRSLREAKARLDTGQKFFIKPERVKRFTGFVAQFSDDFRFYGASNQMPVWISEVVKFLSEWRVYVVNGNIRYIAFADGFRGLMPDPRIIETAVATFTLNGAPAGYVLDFGVTAEGTSLVEFNDGFSVGAYDGVDAKTYWDMIVARWEQILKPELL